MNCLVGIDIGSSATKVVCIKNSELIYSKILIENSAINSFDMAVEAVINDLNIDYDDIKCISLTGAGSIYTEFECNNVQIKKVSEYTATGLGGLYLTGLKEAVIASMGTGTAFYHVKNNEVNHIIGTGVGGGTINGLSRLLLDTNTSIEADVLASKGNTTNVDLTIKDISNGDMPGLPSDLTASNFGKVHNNHSREDVAAGMFNMVIQTIGTMSVLISRLTDERNVILTGGMSTMSQCGEKIKPFGEFYGINIITPENSMFATAIGACLVE